MHLISSTQESLTKFHVAMKDGTIQEVEAGCYKLTSDGYWTFYKDKQLPKLGGFVLHSIDMRHVKGIYTAEHVVTLEAMLEKSIRGNVKTEVRKKSTKKKESPKASATKPVK